jgi:GH15 family glucan-1,4-alpha-glucosidase
MLKEPRQRALKARLNMFLPCFFWLADNYLPIGRRDDAHRLFERVLSVANDVGLLAEQYDPRAERLPGNSPRALSHVSPINTARKLARASGPAETRKGV